jgi:hypothetical protein
MATSVATLAMPLPMNVVTFLELAYATATWALPHHVVVAALRRRYTLLSLLLALCIYCSLGSVIG